MKRIEAAKHIPTRILSPSSSWNSVLLDKHDVNVRSTLLMPVGSIPLDSNPRNCVVFNSDEAERPEEDEVFSDHTRLQHFIRDGTYGSEPQLVMMD